MRQIRGRDVDVYGGKLSAIGYGKRELFAIDTLRRN